jgi:NAD(P) transhydrogenase alpha subunit
MGFAIAALGIISLDNLLIISGSLLGTSSLILGFRLAKVIYRNLISVMLCSFSQGISEETTYPSFKAYETVSSQELIKQVKISSNILVVPGYGVIKSGCEGKIVEFFNILQGTGKNIMMCIHPVAGRLPGHLDLVFQEAGLDPKFIQSVEESNQKMKETDLVITIGANDIINPGAIDYSNSALGGFPVIRVWESKSSVIFLPRPDSLGFCRQNLTLSEKPKVRFMYADANILLMGMLREAKSRKHSLIRYNPLDASNEPEVIQMMDYPKPFLSIGVPRETEHLEKRVAMTPSMVSKFRMLGFRVYVQAGAGRAAGFFDEEYEKNDAQVVDEESVWDNDVILKIQKPSNEEFELLSSVKLVVSYVYPSKCSNFLDKISKRYPKLTYIAMDLVPKSNRGQSVDSVKLMQSIEGYRAIIEAFIAFDRSPKPMITAAGKLPPAQVVILGTDVAGISAVSYSKSLGCVTSAVDTRSIHKDEIEKLHASFITSKPAAEGEDPRKLFHETLKTTLKNSDIVICTSLIHNYEKIVDDVLIHEMKPGSILVDVYGNLCSKTVRDNQVVSKNGVKILHFSDLTSRMAPQASEFYSTCLYNIFLEIYNGEQLKMNELDDLVGSMMVVKEGRMLWYSRPPVSPITALVHTGKIAFRLSFPPEQDTSESFWRKLDFLWISAALAAYIITFSFISSFHKDWDIIMENFLVLVLALIIGWIIFRNTSTIYYANLIARAVGVTGIVLAVAFRYWKNLDVFGVVVASSLTFGFAFSFCFVFGIAFKTCEQYKEVTKKVLKIG